MARGDIKVRLLGDISDLSNSLSDAGSRVGEFASGLTSKIGLGAAAAGAAGAAVFVKGFSDGLNFDATIDQLSAQLGLTDDAAAQAGDAAASLYSNAWGDSLEEVSAAIGSVAQNDLVDLESASQDTVETITAGVLDISKAFNEDFGAATRAAGQLVRTGLAGDATEALDLITAGFQGGVDRSGDFLDTLNEYAPAFSRLGLDGATAIGLLSQGLDAGAFNADKIGDAFNEFSIRAIDGSANTIAAVEDLGFSYDEFAAKIAEGGPTAAAASDDIIRALANVDDKVTQDAAGVALFGSIWEDLGADVITALNPAEAAVTDFDGAAARMGDTLNDNLGTKIETLKRTALTGLATFMSDTVIPVVENVMEVFDEDGLAGVFALVSQAIEDALPDVLDALEDMAEEIIAWIVETAPEVADQLVAWAQEFVEWIGPQIEPMLRELGRLIGAMLNWLLENIDEIVATLAEWGAKFVAWVAPMIPPLLLALAGLLGELLAWIVTDAAPKIAAKLLEWAVQFGEWVAKAGLALLLNLPSLISAALTAGGRAGEELVEAFVGWLRGLPGQVRDWAVAAGEAIADGIMSGVGNLGQRIVDGIIGGGALLDEVEKKQGGGGGGGKSSGGGTKKSSGGIQAAGVFGAAGLVPGLSGVDASFSDPRNGTVTIINNFGPGTNPVEAGREIEELLYRFSTGGGTIRVTSTDPLVANVGG